MRPNLCKQDGYVLQDNRPVRLRQVAMGVVFQGGPMRARNSSSRYSAMAYSLLLTIFEQFIAHSYDEP